MSYCLNPACQKPQNPAGTNFCLACGTKLQLKDRYRAIAPIGEGGFGRTFLAEDTDRLNTHCVIKQLFPLLQIQGSSGAMSKASLLFEQEARRLLELGEQHPQIPTLFGYFEQNKILYLVQQYIEGQDLEQELEQQGAFSEQQIRELLNDLLPVLQFVHENQVIHRDIKPTNIVRRRSDRKFVLIDFGVSKQLSATGLAKTGTRTGTEGFAPIEQLRGGKAFPASDLYSLGVTCIHLLTSTEIDELYDPLEGNWLWKEQLSTKGVVVSDRLTQVLDKILKEYVKERYQSALEVLKDLNQLETSSVIASNENNTTNIQITYPIAPVPLAPQAQPEIPTWEFVRTLTGHSNLVRSVAFSLDGKILASGSWDNTIKLWNMDTNQLIHTLTGHSDPVSAVVFSPDNQIIASGSADGSIKLWQSSNGRLMRSLRGHTDWIKSVAISPNGETLASGSDDNTIKIWQIDSGVLNNTLFGHLYPVSSVTFSPDGQILASCSSDHTIKLWQANDGKLISTLTGHTDWIKSIAITPDCQTLVSGSRDNTIKLWQISTGKLIRTLTGHSKGVWWVAIAPDGKIIASASSDNTINLWRVDTGELIQTLKDHAKGVRCVAFSPDHRTLASGSAENTITIWRSN
ncbi:MAG: serine/threonine-protein kinase [Crinalium sp.]